MMGMGVKIEEGSLRENMRLQIDCFEQSPIAIELYNKQGRLTDANQACLDLFGIKSAEAVRGFDLFEDPNLPEKAKLDLREGKPVRNEFCFDFELVKEKRPFETSHSDTCFLECFINPTYDNHQELNGYIVNIIDITERKTAEDQRLLNEQNYHTIFNFITEAILIQDAVTGKILDVNDAMIKMYGYHSRQAVLSCTIGELSSNIAPYTEETALKYIRLAGTEGPQTFEWQARRFDGSLFWIEITLKKTLIGNDNRILAVGKDITERKKTEEILVESENKYRSLIQHSSDPIFSFNPDYSYRFVNEAFAKPFGKKAEEIIGKTPFDIFSTEEATKRLNLVRKVFQTGETHEIEVKVDAVSGDVRYYLTMADPIKSDSGKVLYVTCVSKDITERKRTENALIESRELYRNLIELAVDGVLVGSEEGYIIDANSCFCEMLGRNKDELIGLHISKSAFTDESLQKTPLEFDRLKNGEVVVNERNVIRPDGSELAIEMRTKMMPDRTYQSIFRDVSHRKKSEADIKLKNEELSILNSTKDRFLSIIAHDLKNPFNAILGFTDLMLKNYDEIDDDTIIKGLKTIESASTQAYQLLEHLLIWTQNQTGRTQFHPEELNLREQVFESIYVAESSAIRKRITIKNSIDKSLTIFADRNMIDTILRNLISNAIKYSFKSGEIEVSAIKNDLEIQISVNDHGVGISPEKLKVIFNIDKRTSSAGTDNEQGTGLGLILCKDFVEKHHGKLWIESTKGVGSKFTFSLPIN